MLPPFVPPSARSASEHLPLITDYVIDRVERSFGATFMIDPSASGGSATGVLADSEVSPLAEEAAPAAPEVAVAEREVAPAAPASASESVAGGFIVGGIEYSTTLPSIEDFVLRAPYVERPGAADTDTNAIVEPSVESPLVQLGRHSPTSSATTDRSLQVANAQPVAPVANETATAATTPPPISTPQPSTAPLTNGDWVEAERNSFDWQSVATLAAPADEAERAAQEWMATDWDTPSASPSEYVAAVLIQLARRVRSGDLAIEAVRGMSREAALAAVLTALLSEPDKAR